MTVFAALLKLETRNWQHNGPDGPVHRDQGGGPLMNAMRRLGKRLTASLFGRQDDDRLREELAEHLDLLTEDYAQAGVPLEEARRRARLKLGAADATTEAWRDQQRLRWLED